MTIHKLSGGSGYTYLTRQVAVGDQTRSRGEDMASYYVVDGQPPGVWWGQATTDLGVDGEVTEDQMKALFGEGRHPDADRIEAEMIAAGASPAEAMAATRLGRAPYKFRAAEDDGFTGHLDAVYTRFRDEHDRDPRPGVERDALRRDAARSLLAEKGRGTEDTTVASYLATRGRGPRQNVAGFDCVFTPAKSVSVLWALGDDEVHQGVRAAHEAAWRQAMEWVQEEASVTRAGVDGVAQLDARGLVATAFEHHDSRAGDPNLHTHVAIANRVQAEDGTWRTLDARVLHSLAVAASERYNSLIETELADRLGLQFHDVARGRGKRPVREIVGVDERLIETFSSRRVDIEEAYAELLAEYRAAHGYEPSKAQQWKLQQQATLDTRDAKAGPRRLSEQRAEWAEHAGMVLGDAEAVDDMVNQVRAGKVDVPARLVDVGEDQVDVTGMSADELADLAVRIVAEDRSTWTRWNIQAQAQRLARLSAAGTDQDVQALADEVGTRAEENSAIRIHAPELNPVPYVMRRRDGESIYRVHGGDRHTSQAILDAEDNLLQAARLPGGLRVSNEAFEQAHAQIARESGRDLNTGQRELARRFACGGHLVEVGIGPAGSGKTTAMRAAVRAISLSGGRVLALGPSAAAASVLGDELDVQADTVHKLLAVHARAQRTGSEVAEAYRIDAGTVLLVDEAGMAGTPRLSRLLDLARTQGASVRLLGDPAQLSAVEAGGALRLIASRVGAAELSEVHRFRTPADRPGWLARRLGKKPPSDTLDVDQAAASLALRSGDARGLDYYVTAGRVHAGSHDGLLEDIYAAWRTDIDDGLHSLMIASSNTDVAALNARARADLVAAGRVDAGGVVLHDGTTAGRGDQIVTRRNERRLAGDQRDDWVRNGDVWTVERTNKDGSLNVRHVEGGHRLTLPADYVGEDVELAYAATVHRVQGMTVDRAHLLVEPGATREQLYVGATRARYDNHLYAVTEHVLDLDADHAPDPQRAARDVLETVLGHEGAELSATETIAETLDRAGSLATLVPEYEDAATRLLDPDRAARMAAYLNGLTDTDPALIDDILADPAWPSLAARMAAHEAAGEHLPDLMSAAITARELDTARSVAEVLHHRLGDVDQHTDDRLPPWATPPPPESAALVEREALVRQWIDRQADLIGQRTTELVDQVATGNAEWITPTTVCPTDPTAAAQWRQAARTVVAYRDQYEVRGQDPLGPEQSGIRGQRRRRAEDALDRITQLSTTPAPRPADDGADQRVQVASRLDQIRQRRQAAEDAGEQRRRRDRDRVRDEERDGPQRGPSR